MQFKTSLEVDVVVTFNKLDETVISGALLPAMLDITKVGLRFVQKNGKEREINIIKALTEQQLMLIEDEINETL